MLIFTDGCQSPKSSPVTTVNRANNIQRTFSNLVYILLSFSALEVKGVLSSAQSAGKEKQQSTVPRDESHYLLGCSWSIWIFFQLRLGVTAPKGIRL